MNVIKWDGKPITKNGIYSGIPLRTYHSKAICDGDSVSSSNIRTAWNESLAHMHNSWCCNPQAEPMEPTESMLLGSAAHHLILGEEDFSTHYIGQPLEYRDIKTAELKKWTYGAKPCKDWRDKQHKAGKEIVTQVQLEKIRGIARSLQLDPLVQAGSLNGLIEHSVIVKDPETGLWLRWRPDSIPTDSGNYVDLKVTAEVSDVAVRSMIRNYGYHVQGAFGWEVCDQLSMPFEDFTLLLCESVKPHCIRAVPIHDDDLARGRMQIRHTLRQIRQCIDQGVWPGPGAGDLRPMPLPQAEREAIDKRLGYGEQA